MAELNIRQERFLKALLETGTIDEACKKAKINRSTGYKYLKEDAFLSEYRALRREAMQQVTAKLQKRSKEAVDVLAEVMLDKDSPATSRVQSAKNVLDMAYKAIELDDIGERLEKLEDSFEIKP